MLSFDQRLIESFSFRESGGYEAALVLTDRALHLRPLDALAQFHHASNLVEVHRLAEAEILLWRSIGIDAKIRQSWFVLGVIYEERAMLRRAAFCYEKMLELNLTAEGLTLLANMQLGFGLKAALENAEHALLLRPDWREAADVRRRALRELGAERDAEDGE